jgi:hypothetical protein
VLPSPDETFWPDQPNNPTMGKKFGLSENTGILIQANFICFFKDSQRKMVGEKEFINEKLKFLPKI